MSRAVIIRSITSRCTMLEIIETNIPGVIIVEPKVFGDARGYFMETWRQEEFDAKVRPVKFVQDNESSSGYGVVRGLHFQKGRAAQGKLVRVTQGRVLDIAVDIRRGSPTFGAHVAVELSGENNRQMFIPRGFAHGFAVLSEKAVFQYKCDNYYVPSAEGSVAWDDPDLGIDWTVPQEKILLSAKDKMAPRLKDAAELFDYNVDYYSF